MAKNKKIAKKTTPKPAKPAAKKAVAAKKIVVPAKPVSVEAKAAAAKKSARDDLRNRILNRKVAKPIAFSLDEVREIAKTNTTKAEKAEKAGKPVAKTPLGAKPVEPLKTEIKPSPRPTGPAFRGHPQAFDQGRHRRSFELWPAHGRRRHGHL
ncbi:MAG: hypothetical protein ABSE59_09665 [Opitutaceae bacterium]